MSRPYTTLLFFLISYIHLIPIVHGQEELIHTKSIEDYERCEEMGLCHIKDKEVRHTLKKGKKVIYDVTYRFDSYRRRITPHQNAGATKHLITSGCSFALGVGVHENETLAYYLSQALPKTKPYNYGLAGSGTNSMLAQTQNFIHKESIPEEEGYFIYSLLNFHVPRSNALSMEREWLWDTPIYERQEDHLKHIGSFKEAQPLLTSFYHALQSTFRAIGLKLNFPPLRQKHYLYTCELIHETRQIYKSRFPKGRFIVYDHPFDEVHPILKSCLEERQVEVIRSKISYKKDDYILEDKHPNANLNQKSAREIAQYLKTKHSLDSF